MKCKCKSYCEQGSIISVDCGAEVSVDITAVLGTCATFSATAPLA